MAKNVTIAGVSYSDVPSINIPITGGGTATFYDEVGTKSITANGNNIDVHGFAAVNVNVSGGGGGTGTLLGEYDLGQISTSQTSAKDTLQSMSVSGVNAYDLIIVEVESDGGNNKHYKTITLIYLTASSNVSTKDGTAISTAKMNAKKSSSGVVSSRSSTTAYGIYVNTAGLSNGVLTLSFYMRYNSTQTGTINSEYTARAYGVKLL